MYLMESSALLTTLGGLFNQITTWMGNIATTITSNELYLLGIGMFVVGGAIGLVKRIIG